MAALWPRGDITWMVALVTGVPTTRLLSVKSGPLGQAGGEAAHVLAIGEMPAHAHLPIASGDAPDTASPANSFWANSGISTYYSSTPNTALATDALVNAGQNQPHENLSPYLVLNLIIAIDGSFPIRS